MIETIGKPNQERDVNDFYATDPKAVFDIIILEKLYNKYILENSAGNGHIVKELLKHNNRTFSCDLIDRGKIKLDHIGSFLELQPPNGKIFDCAVYNPPFKLVSEFILKTWEFTDVQYVFARLQLLETSKRYDLIYKNNWLEKVYVYTGRMTTAKGGDNSLFGKNNSMAFAWFKFNKNNDRKPIIEWIN